MPISLLSEMVSMPYSAATTWPMLIWWMNNRRWPQTRNTTTVNTKRSWTRMLGTPFALTISANLWILKRRKEQLLTLKVFPFSVCWEINCRHLLVIQLHSWRLEVITMLILTRWGLDSMEIKIEEKSSEYAWVTPLHFSTSGFINQNQLVKDFKHS